MQYAPVLKMLKVGELIWLGSIATGLKDILSNKIGKQFL